MRACMHLLSAITVSRVSKDGTPEALDRQADSVKSLNPLYPSSNAILPRASAQLAQYHLSYEPNAHAWPI